MKKAIALFLSVLTVSSLLLFPASATSFSNSECPFDIEQFCNSAEMISETAKITVFEQTTTDSTNTLENGDVISSVSTTSVGIVAIPKDSGGVSTTGSSSDDEWDKSGQIKIYATVHFSKTTKTNGDVFVKVTKVTGGITAPGSGASVGSGVAVTSNKCLVAMFGKDASSTTRNYKKTFTYDTGKRSWSSSTPSTWKPVLKCSASMAGCTYTVALKRGNSSWSVELPINIC